ncbi:MAG TPA: rhodanese-like domain-containing protein [Syntrophales bacterium]|nr:rhodanese-like domain-containing protein [Syntrophales bacterium]HOM06820.1 rhodanese-like domain-containing protein [Syntrophales bacterium]HPQ06022.1 rhodanese-like domain-containing protein [Syntrophales bacterium]
MNERTVILFVVLVFLALLSPVPAAAGDWKPITPRELAAALAAKDRPPVVINNMSLIECLDHSIAGSLCIPAEEFAARIGELPPDKDRPVVFFCESERGDRSCTAAETAVKKGYKAVYVLEGGLPAWKREGYETVSVQRVERLAIPSLKPAALERRLDLREPLLVVDLRPEDRFAQGHIPGALNLPLYQLHRRWRELPLDRTLILVDNRGFRSHLAASYLAGRGYRVAPLFGGMRAWLAMKAKEGRSKKAGK